MPHVDIELEDNKQFISNIPRIYGVFSWNIIYWDIGTLMVLIKEMFQDTRASMFIYIYGLTTKVLIEL